MLSRSRRFWTLAAALWAGVILFSSSSTAARWCESGFDTVCDFLRLHSLLPPEGQGFGLFHFMAEKGMHITLFLVFAVLLWRAIPNVALKFGVIIAMGLVLGSMSEYFQSFFPGRDPSPRDVAINVAGTTLGALASIAARRRFSSQSQPSSE